MVYLFRHDVHIAELPKMLIEGESRGDGEPLDDRSAGAIREAPAFIAESPKGFPGDLHVGRRYPFELSNQTIQQQLASLNRPIIFPTALHQRQQLIDDIVGCNQLIGVVAQPSVSDGMLRVVGNKDDKPSICVDKNHS